MTGFTRVIAPGFTSVACDFVVRDLRERARKTGSPTKTGAQLVSATAIYDLGFVLMDQARARRTRGMRAALDFGNGMLLAVAIAIPQRARALSVLEFAETISLLDAQHLHIQIPAQHLKLPEAKKDGPPFVRIIQNPTLAAALLEYIRDFRPIFDAGALLFPSYHAPETGLSENCLGQIAGRLTQAKFGTRISIHRFRDNVATELSETVAGGARMVGSILGHKSLATVTRHYERSEGLKAANEFLELLETRRSAPQKLLM